MLRVFVVLSVVLLILLTYYSYKDIDKAIEWKRDNISASGVTITAIMPGSSSHDEKVKNRSLINVPVVYGWAAYLCLYKVGQVLYVGNDHIANSRMLVQEFSELINTKGFKQCIKSEITDANIKISQAIIKNIMLSLLSLTLLYLTLLLVTSVIAWVIRGFKINNSIN